MVKRIHPKSLRRGPSNREKIGDYTMAFAVVLIILWTVITSGQVA